jgi:hypothetical protein
MESVWPGRFKWINIENDDPCTRDTRWKMTAVRALNHSCTWVDDDTKKIRAVIIIVNDVHSAQGILRIAEQSRRDQNRFRQTAIISESNSSVNKIQNIPYFRF